MSRSYSRNSIMSAPMHPTSILSLDEKDKKVDQTSNKGTANLGLCYKKSNQYRLKGYSDAYFAGDRIERKRTNGGCDYIGANLVSWTSKRQGTIALSIAKVEYISTTQCCFQLMWIKHQLEDYNIFKSKILLLYDNTTTINLSKNPILHSHAKHIEIKHHFTRDYVKEGTLDLKFINIENQLTEIFTKKPFL
ncbi:Copia protein, partial [Mucuna pruriens]